MPTRNKSTSQERMFRPAVSPMPEGYYSGDQPNPNLRAFVEKYGQPYDLQNDTFYVQPFNKVLDIGNRRSPINDLHIYWSKKPHSAVQEYINHYTKPGDLILDSFSGSGGTALCALRMAVA